MKQNTLLQVRYGIWTYFDLKGLVRYIVSQRDGLLSTGIGESNELADLMFCMGCSLPSLMGSSHHFEIVMLQESVTWTQG